MNTIILLIFITILLFITIPNQASEATSDGRQLNANNRKITRDLFFSTLQHNHLQQRRLLDDEEEEDVTDTTDDDDDVTDTTTDDESDDNENDDDNESQGSVDDVDAEIDELGSADGALFKKKDGHLEYDRQAHDEYMNDMNDMNKSNYDIIMLLIGTIWCLLFLFIFANGVFFYMYYRLKVRVQYGRTREYMDGTIKKNEFSSSEIV